MKMKKILIEKVFDTRDRMSRFDARNTGNGGATPLTKDEILNLRNLVKQYKTYGQSLINETDLLELSDTFYKMAQGAKRYVESMDNIDDLDEAILKKDIKVLEDAANEFKKTAIEVVKLQKRMKASYDDMGTKLNRYFEMD